MPTPALRDLQGAFWRHLATAPGDEAGRPIAPALRDVLVGNDELPAAERLAIYERMYFWRLVDVLREDHPRTAAVLGEEVFRDAVRGYLARHPSTHPSVGRIGRGFGDFLGTGVWPTTAPGLPPWTADLARLEWARREVFEAPDAPVLGLDALRALAPEAWGETRFGVVPGLLRLAAGWPVQRAWAAAADAGPIDLPAERTALRVWRSGFSVFHAVMDRREEAALATLAAGEPFAAVCEVFADLPEENSASEAATLLVTWIEDGMVCTLNP